MTPAQTLQYADAATYIARLFTQHSNVLAATRPILLGGNDNGDPEFVVYFVDHAPLDNVSKSWTLRLWQINTSYSASPELVRTKVLRRGSGNLAKAGARLLATI